MTTTYLLTAYCGVTLILHTLGGIPCHCRGQEVKPHPLWAQCNVEASLYKPYDINGLGFNGSSPLTPPRPGLQWSCCEVGYEGD